MAKERDRVSDVGEAVSRITYLASHTIVSVQPVLKEDSIGRSQTLNRLKLERIHGLEIADPEVLEIGENADPLLSAVEPALAGRKVAVITPIAPLLQGLPHLYRLAEYPVVLHVSLISQGRSDFTDLTSIRQCGFAMLHSETLQEAQDMAVSSHSLAVKSNKGVIHFFDPKNSAHDDPVEYEDQALLKDLLTISNTSRGDNEASSLAQQSSESEHSAAQKTDTSQKVEASENDSAFKDLSFSQTAPSEQILQHITEIWSVMLDRTKRSYYPFEYTGPNDAENAVFIFGSTGIFVDQILDSSSSDALYQSGIITARLYRPWIAQTLIKTLPPTIKRIAVLEECQRQTSKWSPIYLDVITALCQNQGETHKQAPLVISYRLGHIDESTVLQALRGILQNLQAETPVQNLEVGQAQLPLTTLELRPVEQPALETAYLKLLEQVFGERLYIANQPGTLQSQSTYVQKTSPDFAYGALVAQREQRDSFIEETRDAVASFRFATDAPRTWLNKWLQSKDDSKEANKIGKEVIERLEADGSELATRLLSTKQFFLKQSDWIIGSDAWAYDVGNSGVQSVLTSGADINMLIIESRPWSERTAADAARRKKDIGLYAMNFGNAYVASVAVYGSYTQVLEAMIEADQFVGPSIVVAYLPYHSTDDSPLNVLQETKKAVDLGYWPLYRWCPNKEDDHEPNFKLDSTRIKQDLEDFLRRDNQLTQLSKRYAQFAPSLSESYGSELKMSQQKAAKEAYEKLIDGLYTAPLTILFASDNGNAEGVAKRLATRGKTRGLRAKALAMDEYSLQHLSAEENVVLVTSTAGQGEFPQNGRAFWEAIRTSNDLDLSSIHFAVFALGDSHYWPREEDRIYYNKSGKDIDERVGLLGGKRLTEIGLGDDQDPDGYKTAYEPWEENLWRALHVDQVEGAADEAVPITNEDIKIQSNFLRGTIAEGLVDTSTGAIAASDQQLTKFHGLYMQDDRDLRNERKARGLEPAYSFMIRCRLNGGVATPAQWLQMDQVSSRFGNHTMKLTTRQTFQFHGVIKSRLRPAMREINKAFMTTIAACGDVNRNVMCSVLPTKSDYHRDVHQVACKISDHLLPSTSAYHEIWLKDVGTDEKQTQVAGNALVDQEPLYGPTYLPRKFKITIAIPPDNDTDVYAHDVGLIAIKTKEGRLDGFNVLVGGGMGVTHNNKKTYPRTGSMLGYVSKEKTHLVCEKIMIVQRNHGDRANRKHARLKYTVDDMGVEVFKSKVEDLLGWSFSAPKAFHFKSNVDTFGWQRDEYGFNHHTFFIENGRIEDTPSFPMKTGLCEIAKTHKGEFRLTGNQHLCISNVADADLDSIKNLMKKYKLDNVQFSGLRLSSSACVAFPTCGLAMAESERYLPQLISKLEGTLEEVGLRHDSIVMRMTGCPNGCARPWLAEIGFVGKAYGAYNMYLGGGYHGQRLNKLYRSSIQEGEILDILKPMLGRYARERNEGEPFGDWTIRAGYVKPTLEGKAFHDDVTEGELA